MIRDLPISDKPREKALSLGINNLTDAELLAIIIRTGTKDISSLDLAQKIIKEMGSLSNFYDLTFERLNSIKGVGKSKALSILSTVEIGKRLLKKTSEKIKISKAQDVFKYYNYYFNNLNQEIFMILFLDSGNHITSFNQLYKGHFNHISVEPTEIFKEAFKHSSNKIILIHNHPSGNIYPSKEDLITTKNLVKKAKMLDIEIVDHIIITNNNYYSFLENGDLK